MFELKLMATHSGRVIWTARDAALPIDEQPAIITGPEYGAICVLLKL